MSHSFYDKNHKLFVACLECMRGSNGRKDCSAGWKTRSKDLGCFSGELIKGIVPGEWKP